MLFNNFTSEKIEFNGQFLIAIPNSEANNDSTISKILSDCWSLYITKVDVLVPNDSYNGIFLYTYYPFTEVHCEQAEPFVYNYFENDSFVAHKSHFPFKLANLHRCPLRVSTFDLPPHMILIEFANGTIYTDGIEGITLRVLSQRMNFTPIIVKGTRNVLVVNTSETANVTTNSSDLRPTLNLVSSTIVFIRFVAAHIFNCPIQMIQVRDGIVNFSLGATFLSSQRPFEISASFPFYYGSLLFMIPPGHPYTPFKKLFLPFEMRIWLCILISLLAAIWILIAFKTCLMDERDFIIGRGNNMPLINLFLVCLGGAMTIAQMPTRNFARTILAILLVTTLILRNAYQGNLFNFLRTQKNERPLYYRRDIFNSDVDVYVTTTFYEVYRQQHPQTANR